MFIYFEDWTTPINISLLDRKKLVHLGRIIKVFSVPFDPRKELGLQDLNVFEIDGVSCLTEIFKYPGREDFEGIVLEKLIKEANYLNQEVIRSLFRFANSAPLESAKVAMSLKNKDGSWKVESPIEVLDGIKDAVHDPKIKKLNAHLDLFSPTTITLLGQILNLDKESNNILSWQTGSKLRTEILKELNGTIPSPERR